MKMVLKIPLVWEDVRSMWNKHLRGIGWGDYSEDLISEPHNHLNQPHKRKKKMLGRVEYICNPSSGEMETGGSLDLWPAALTELESERQE